MASQPQPFIPGQAYVYSLMPRAYLIDRLTAGERLYQGPDGRLSFKAPRRRNLLTFYYQDAPARPEVFAELLREGWVRQEQHDGRATFVRRPLKGRQVQRPASEGGPATIVRVAMTMHARAGAVATLRLADGREVNAVLSDLHLI